MIGDLLGYAHGNLELLQKESTPVGSGGRGGGAYAAHSHRAKSGYASHSHTPRRSSPRANDAPKHQHTARQAGGAAANVPHEEL